MKVYRDLKEFTKLDNAVVSTGTFDGVHNGHKIILQRLCKTAEQTGGESVLITFDPHPRLVLNPTGNTDLKLLTTVEEKIALLEAQGIQHLLIIPFTPEFAQTSGEAYIKDILVRTIGVKKLVIGYDHRFGKGRGGSFKELVEMAPTYGFEVEEIPAVEIDDSAISSTKIRKAIAAGDMEGANEKLGYPYALSGRVVKGHQLGRTIQFPTANIEPEDSLKLIPAIGVYAATVELNNKEYYAMVNIGVRPTFGGNKLKIETHIINFEEDIYHKTICIRFRSRIRPEIKFASADDLKIQLQKDKNTILRILADMGC